MNGFRLLIFGLSSFAASTVFAQAPTAALAGRLHFRESRQTYYRVEFDLIPALAANAPRNWVKAWPETGSRFPVEFGSRVGLQLKPGTDLRELVTGSPLTLSRVVAPNLFILQAPDATTALIQAQRLADQPEVLMSCPVRRRLQLRLHGPYSSRPNDSYFSDQWNLENRDATGASLGVDLNLRAAWPFTRGK